MTTMQFLKVKSIPLLFSNAPVTLTLRPLWLSAIMLVFGLKLFGLGETIFISSNPGVSPWTVLVKGLSSKREISFGLTTS